MIFNRVENGKGFCSNPPSGRGLLKEVSKLVCLVPLIVVSCTAPVPDYTIDHGRLQSAPTKMTYGTIPITPVPGNDQGSLLPIGFAGYGWPSLGANGELSALGVSCDGFVNQQSGNVVAASCMCVIVSLSEMGDNRLPDSLIAARQSALGLGSGRNGEINHMPNCATGHQMCGAITSAPTLHPGEIPFFGDNGHNLVVPFYDLHSTDGRDRENYCSLLIGERN